MAYNVGVNLLEGIGNSPIEGVSTAISGIMGTFERGPLNVATLVTSMAQFERTFGSVPATGSTSWYSVKAFFKGAGNASLYVVRIASSTAAKALYNFDDSAAADTIRIEAKNEGTYANLMSVQIVANSILTTAPAVTIIATSISATLLSIEGIEIGSDLQLYNGSDTEHVRITAVNAITKEVTWVGGLSNEYTTSNGVLTTEEFSVLLYISGILIETHAGLGTNTLTSFFIEKKLVSDYIVGTFIKASPDVDYQDLPAAIAATSLAGGLDGLADVVEADYSGVQVNKSGVYAFDEVEDLFRLCCPNPLLTDADIGIAYQALIQNLIDYTDARVTLQLYADVAYGLSITAAVTWGANYTSRRLAVFFSWFKVIENSLIKWLPPSSLVMGIAVGKDNRRGVHKSIGNEVLPYAIDLEYNVSVAEGEILNNAGINTIRKFSGRGIRVFGARTRSSVTAWRFLHVSELWNYIGKSLAIATQNVSFEPHDAILWKSVIRRIEAFLANEHKNGALFDASDPTGIPYNVIMDVTNNPPEQVALGIAKVSVEYVPVSCAEKFVIELTSSPTGLTINS